MQDRSWQIRDESEKDSLHKGPWSLLLSAVGRFGGREAGMMGRSDPHQVEKVIDSEDVHPLLFECIQQRKGESIPSPVAPVEG